MPSIYFLRRMSLNFKRLKRQVLICCSFDMTLITKFFFRFIISLLGMFLFYNIFGKISALASIFTIIALMVVNANYRNIILAFSIEKKSGFCIKKLNTCIQVKVILKCLEFSVSYMKLLEHIFVTE